MTLDTTLERIAMAEVVDAFEAYVKDRFARDLAPETFFHEAGIAIRNARSSCDPRFEHVPDAYVIALVAYLPDIAERVLSPRAAKQVARAYPDFFSER